MYQVWTKSDEYTGWARKDCEDLGVAQAEIFAALKRGAEPLLTVEVPFDVSIKIKEGKALEVTKIKAEPGEGPGAKSKGKVRPGDTDPVPSVNP